MKIKRHYLVGSSILVWHLSVRLGMEICLKVTVGMGFGAMSMNRFSSACTCGVKRESQWQNLEGIPTFKELEIKRKLEED